MDSEAQKQLQRNSSFQILPVLSPEEQAKMEKQYRERLTNFYEKNKKYEIDYWYPALKQYTYPSFSFPLTAIECYILHLHYYEHQLSQECRQAQQRLILKINNLLRENKNQQNKGKYFMKLSTRSPKDYCWDYRNEHQFQKAVLNLKKFLQNQMISLDTPVQKLNNILYKFFLANSHKRLLIESGNDFIRIFSKSQRIITDINDFSYLAGGLFQKIKQNKLHEEGKTQTLINAWVRDWDDCKWEQEFRSFYCNYKLTGISQYDQKCYFSQLKDRKIEIAHRCLQLFDKIKSQLQSIDLDKGVLDFIIKKDLIKIVEINVFDKDARSSLFNWAEDQKILMDGPLEVRVLEKEIQISKAHLGSIMGMIDKKSIDVITKALEQTGLLSIWK